MPASILPDTCNETARTSSRPLRRLSLELFGVITLKIVVLLLIWWVAFAPHPKPDISPAAIARQLAPTPQTPPTGHP